MTAAELTPLPTACGVTEDDIRWAESVVEDARKELDEAEHLLTVLRTILRDQQGRVFA